MLLMFLVTLMVLKVLVVLMVLIFCLHSRSRSSSSSFLLRSAAEPFVLLSKLVILSVPLKLDWMLIQTETLFSFPALSSTPCFLVNADALYGSVVVQDGKV